MQGRNTIAGAATLGQQYCGDAADVPMKETAFSRLSNTVNESGRVAERLEMLADRLVGGSPKVESTKACEPSPAGGIVGEIWFEAERLENNLNRMDFALYQIERALP